ncbi:MAG: TonB-dependent starch-binding outer membrane protein SusC [Mucilaginibacter sp.]|nr:TonB-dependent starch-binding outer membrane protein SusC [Mucilaginibacter sp.]
MGKILRMTLLFISLLMCFRSMAQNPGTVIKGTVTDDKGATLPGVSVTVKGTTTGVITDVNGKYTITVPAGGKTLVFSFIGMERQEIPIGTKAVINVSMQLSSTALSNVDVVAIGYGSQKRGDINGAISSVSAKDIQDIPMPSIDQMLQGKAAGVTITQNSGAPGATVSVRVRGITSFNGSEPLYVIDGVAIDGNANNGHQLTSQASPSQQETSASPLAQLNPNDIESIDVLKDASATAIYGSRGSNGVVIITTKKGKNGTAKINYDGYYGVQTQGKFLKMMNLPQYAAYENTLADQFGQQRRIEFSDPSVLGPGTNWQYAIFKNAPEQSHTLSISGARNGTDYYVSGGYYTQQGTVLGSDFNRYTFHTTVNSQVKDWFKVGTSVSANQSFANIGLGNSYGIIYNALLQAPDAAVYNADGSFAGPAVVNGTIEGGLNPVQQALSITNNIRRSNVQGNFYGDVIFNKDFTLHSEIDGNFDWSEAKAFLPTYSYGATGSSVAFVNTQASLNEYNAHDSYWNWVEHLNYNHTFGKKHVVSALVGHEVWASSYDGIQAGTTGFTAGNTIQTLNLGTQANNTLGEPKGSTSMESWLARVIYTFDNKYSITASDRSDRSSNFAQGHQTGYFPGVAVSWRVSEEPFMAGVKQFADNIKLRVGYGTTGNSNIPQYRYGTAINPVVTGLGTGFSFYNFSNPGLTWETAIQKNIGLDFSILNNRIDASIDVYDKTSKNFLFQQPLPAFLGGGTAEYSNAAIVQPPYVNAGEIENKGIELSITSRNIISKNFSWTTNVIFSHYTNKVVSLNGFPSLIGTVSTGFGPSIPATYTQVGGPVGEFYGYKVQGIIKTTAQLQQLAAHPQNVVGIPSTVSSDRTLSNGVYLGDIQYYGENNNGNSPNTQYALGNPNPDFTYSITNTFTYKDFDLSIFLNGSYGGKILNAVDYQIAGMYGLYQNQLATQANFWTPSNPNSNIPAPRSGFGNNNLVMSDRFLESASYLRLQNVRLGYNLPAKWARYVKMTRLKAFVSGQNLYVFTKYTGLDPEVGSLNQNPTLQNIDYGRYPSPRVITFGLNAEF